MRNIIIAFCFLVLIFTASNVLAQQNISNINRQSDAIVETDNKFILQGVITVVNINTFFVSTEIVAMPEELVADLNEKGIIGEGNRVLVIGRIDKNIKIAEKIELISAFQEQTRNETFENLKNTIESLIF